MLMRKKMIRLTVIPFFLLSIAFVGCGGGDDAAPAPALTVLPAAFDFGTVTDGNSVDSLEVTIRNDGTANLGVSDIALSDATNFDLDLGGGANPCVTAATTLGVGSSCTVTVDFLPPAPPAFGTFSADLTIRSNDPTTPVFDLPLLGSLEDINAISVKINQINACPRPTPPTVATVFVSVLDQGGFPVAGLVKEDFELTEGTTASVNPSTAAQINNTVTLSVALLLDYSRSIAVEPVNVANMENAAISFVNQLGATDEAEIIKYATTVERTQAFTSTKADLITAIQSVPDLGTHTALYDAIVMATTDIAASTKTRRAIIIITDGMDDDGTGNPQSTNEIGDAIADANAKGVPVFTVGLGSADVSILTQLADETGGTYSDSTTSSNLTTIYQQLADLLFIDQYILTYSTNLTDAASENLTVTAEYPPTAVTGSDMKTIPACTP
jgi:VWFA-related protein